MQDYVDTLYSNATLAAAITPILAAPLVTIATTTRKGLLADNQLDKDIVLVVGVVKLVYLRAGAAVLLDLASDSADIPTGTVISAYLPGGVAPTSGDLLLHCLM
jgi:hypothetical protein